MKQVSDFYHQAGVVRYQQMADEFWNHYDGQDWLKGNGQPIRKWQSAANSWRLKAPSFDKDNKASYNGDGNKARPQQAQEWKPQPMPVRSGKPVSLVELFKKEAGK